MIRFYYHHTPNPLKICLFIAESGIEVEPVPIDTSKGAQHEPAFRAINPNGKVPAIVDTDGPGGKPVRVFDSTAILLYLADKTGQFQGTPGDRPEMLSWLMFIGTGLGPFSGQALHFNFASPDSLYAANRFLREAERHHQVLNDHLADREYIVGDGLTIADISAWGWLDRATWVFKKDEDPLGAFPHLKRYWQMLEARPATIRARALAHSHQWKRELDEETLRALFPGDFATIDEKTGNPFAVELTQGIGESNFEEFGPGQKNPEP